MNTTGRCLLDYAVTTFPYPLETGTHGTVDVTLSNPDPKQPVSCVSIDVAFTGGMQVLDLANNNDATATATLLGPTSDRWRVKTVAGTGRPALYRLTPASGTAESVAGDGLTLRLEGLPISDQKGAALLTITETTDSSGPSVNNTGICRVDKHEHDLTPPNPVWATTETVTDTKDPTSLAVVSHVPRGKPFTLLWPAYPRLNYRLLWNQTDHTDEHIGNWPSTGRARFHYWNCAAGIPRTTTFQLVSTASGADSPLGSFTVTVPDPAFDELTATTVTVSGKSTLNTVETPTVHTGTFTTTYLDVTTRVDTKKVTGLTAIASRTLQKTTATQYADCDTYDPWLSTTLTVTGTTIQPNPAPPTPAIAVVETQLVGKLTVTVASVPHTFTVGPDQKPFTIGLPDNAEALKIDGTVRALLEDDNYYPITGLKTDGSTVQLATVKDGDKNVDATITEPITIKFSTYRGASGYLDTPITPPTAIQPTGTGVPT